MNPDEVREWVNRKPFEPFCFRLVSGDKYEINDPNTVALGHQRVFVFFTDADRQAIFPYYHVAAIETLASGTGRKRPKRPR